MSKLMIAVLTLLTMNKAFACLNEIPLKELPISKPQMFYLESQLIEKRGNLVTKVELDKTDFARLRDAYSTGEHDEIVSLKYFSLYQVDDNNPFVHDLIFDGTKGPSFVIRDFDFRTIFHKKLRYSGDKYYNCLKHLQAHFSEYERRATVINNERTKSSSIDLETLSREIFTNWKFKNRKYNSFVVTNNCRSQGSLEFEWPGVVKSYVQIPADYLDKLYSKFDQVYSCSGKSFTPMNRKLAETEQRLTKWFEKQIEKPQTPFSIKDFFVSLHSKFFEEHYRWFSLGSFESSVPQWCDQSLIKSKETFTSKIKSIKGMIPYVEFTGETQEKSKYKGYKPPVSFVKIDCDKSPPMGLRSPRPFSDSSPVVYWKKNCGQIIPHTFRKYEDILDYQVHLSKFEVDGVYTGKETSEYEDKSNFYDQAQLTDEDSRQAYDYSYIEKYKEIKLGLNNNLISLNLINEDGKSFYLANLPLSSLWGQKKRESEESQFFNRIKPYLHIKGVNHLVGIAPRPLSYEYNDVELINMNKKPLMSFFYDHNSSKILNHHRRDIGVEQWFLRFDGTNHLILDFVSHERIVPIKRFLIDVSEWKEFLSSIPKEL